MSLALAPVRSTSVRTAPSLPDVPARPVSIAPRQAETAVPAPQSAPAVRTGAPRVRAVPEGTEARGFVLYVGIDEAKALEDGTIDVFSPESPLGAAILGAKVGDQVSYIAPTGKELHVEIVEAKPYAAG